MPKDINDFEALCKQLIISEQILQNKESSENKEITEVIVGITHHEKQQDEEINQQRTEIGNLKPKLNELEIHNKKTVLLTGKYRDNRGCGSLQFKAIRIIGPSSEATGTSNPFRQILTL